MRKLSFIQILVVFGALLLNSSAYADPPLEVYVSILPQKYFVERIGGEKVKVSVMVGPGESPATYEPTPRQMQNLAAARLYFSSGVPFEKVWLKRLKENYPALRFVDSIRGIELRPMRAHDLGADRQYESEGMGVLDPHVWTSPVQVKIIAKNIFRALSEELPHAEKELEANYHAFLQELDRLIKDIRTQLAPVKNRNFLVFHPSWGYFADTFKLNQIAVESEGKEPGARTLNKVIEFAREHDIRVIFVQEQFSRKAARMVAEAIGARIETIDPLAEDYPENLRRVARLFVEAMKP